jgi:hypothetical protein
MEFRKLSFPSHAQVGERNDVVSNNTQLGNRLFPVRGWLFAARRIATWHRPPEVHFTGTFELVGHRERKFAFYDL